MNWNAISVPRPPKSSIILPAIGSCARLARNFTPISRRERWRPSWRTCRTADNTMASDSKSRFGGYLANAFMLALTLALIATAVELYVRLVEDDGMQFDLEMWKYAKSVKTV